MVNNKSLRREIIDSVIVDLNNKKTLCDSNLLFAVNENLNFFESAKSPVRFLNWIFYRASKIDKKKILELSDFGIEKWEKLLLTSLVDLERKKFPGVIKPLKNSLVEYIIKNEPKIILDIGCGGMEVVKQVILQLKDINYLNRIVFVGVDLSEFFYEVAQNNLTDVKDLVDVRIVNFNDSNWREKAFEGDKNLVLLFKENALNMHKFFDDKSIDLIFYSKFAHHLTDSQKLELSLLTNKVSKAVMEYDDYRSWPLLLPQMIFAWNNPILMNGAIFSRLRDYSKKELKNNLEPEWKIRFYPIGSYIKTYGIN